MEEKPKVVSAGGKEIVPIASHNVDSLEGGPRGKLSDPAARLEEMGYKEELTRNLGMVSVLGLSFAIMAVPFGTSTTLNTALTTGGPVTILYGVSAGVRLGGRFG